ncbi:M28 family peptidase [Xanthomonas floridensis]|uniref:Carboxypeptidase Q n=1 Tax=Xanthomonas floridensis TaxID=1843580 RepID=A0A1A9M7D7_9XANT|nr:M28 family peptidase [Xanthomonas floridensis]MEA5122713.1 M28 family peptidase [Xanthomonas floridensis]MEA5131247.1 M28 family peptidase [Xanthomonas floridensis]OAG66235.1 hypothetical protein A7D17_04730 [Xanthomonas floridensis]
MVRPFFCRVTLAALLAMVACSPALAQHADPASIAAVRDQARDGDALAVDLIRSLSTEIGPRPAGSAAEARARNWAVQKLTSLGFSNVHMEVFDFPGWERGAETATITSPYPQKLLVTALGYSAATPAQGIEAEVAAFDSSEDLAAAPTSAVRGKIVLVGHAMQPTQDASGYFQSIGVRTDAPNLASQKGAAAILVRSLATGNARDPHTGVVFFKPGIAAIPAAAISLPDADQLQRMIAAAHPVRLRLVLTPGSGSTRQSANVVADIPGSDPSAGVVLVAAHLDSWDLGTGALDNATGIGILVSAVRRVAALGQPRRTIRVLLSGAEEMGFIGGKAYFSRHQPDTTVVFVGESDFGSGRVWRALFGLGQDNAALADRIQLLLSPLGIVRGRDAARALADLGPWAAAGHAAIDLNQDTTDYFNFHHAAGDTFDKVDQVAVRQNVAAWFVVLASVANAPEPVVRTK